MIPDKVNSKIQDMYKGTNAGAIKINAAEFGYSLAQQEIERLKKLVNAAMVCGMESVKPDNWEDRVKVITDFKKQNNL